MSQGPGIGGKGPEGATSLHTGGEEAGGSRSAGAGEWVGRREGEREEERKEVRPGRCHCLGGGAGPGNGERDCSGARWGRGLQWHSFGGRVCESRLGLPLAYVFPVPPRTQGRRRRAGDCRTYPRAGREPAELGEGKQGPRPLPSPRGRAPAAPAAAGTFPLSQRFSPAGLPRSPGGGSCPRPSPLPPCRGCAPSTLTWKGRPPPLQITVFNLCRASAPGS